MIGEAPVLAFGPIGQARCQRVILSSRGPRQNRHAEIAVIVSYAKGCSNPGDHRGRDQ